MNTSNRLIRTFTRIVAVILLLVISPFSYGENSTSLNKRDVEQKFNRTISDQEWNLMTDGGKKEIIGAGSGPTDLKIFEKTNEMDTRYIVGIRINSYATRPSPGTIYVHSTLYPEDVLSYAGFTEMFGSVTMTGHGRFTSDRIFTQQSPGFTISSTNVLNCSGFPSGTYEIDVGGTAKGTNIVNIGAGFYLRYNIELR